jgi:hypothetical protein
MAFTAFVFVAELLLILFPGVVIHHALARRLLVLDAENTSFPIEEIQLLGFGLLPGLALANTAGTLLAIFHVFYWWSYLTLMILVVGWLWRDALATLSAVGAAFRLSLASLLRGNLMVVVAVAIFLQTGAGLMLEAQLPSGNIDVWHHNLPLAQSIVSHHGFVMPQLPGDMFYGSYPIFFHMFFAEGLLFVDSVIAAKAANALIYIAFLVSLLAVARHARAVAAVFLWILVINCPFLSGGIADAMTDIGRVCFAAMAFVFGYEYFRARRVYFLFASGLLAGGAIAGKYTELLTPLFIGISLLPALVARTRGNWLALAVFVAATAATGAYPYLRNLILLHNPIYPFWFGHPGLSDEAMNVLQAEIFQSLDPVFRTYSHDFFSYPGWRDFFKAAHEVFFRNWKLLYYAYIVILAGFIFLRSRALFLLAFWTAGLWIFWYLVGNANVRWGLTPVLLLLLMAYLALVGSIDRWREGSFLPGLPWRSSIWTVVGAASRPNGGAWLTPISLARVATAICAFVISIGPIQRVTSRGMSYAFPSAENRDLANAALQPGGFEAYLVDTRPGYEIYRYVGDHDLRMVLQPFDNGSGYYQVAYNDGKNGDWLVLWSNLPAKPAEFDEFLRNNKIRYFVYCPTIGSLALERLNQGSYNPQHTAIAFELMRYILPGSRLILRDQFGWELREMPPDRSS